MKTTIKLLAISTLITFWSCSRTDDDNPGPDNTSGKVEQVSGDWVVSYYFDSGKDETYHYNGYTLTFSSNGALEAVSGSSSYSGNWRIGDNSSGDDNSSNRFVITIMGNERMEDLTDDWVIINLSESEIALKDDNPESMEELRFSRKNQ
jgi:hypothetical protein